MQAGEDTSPSFPSYPFWIRHLSRPMPDCSQSVVLYKMAQKDISPNALAGKVMRSVVSVHPSVCPALCFEPTQYYNFWRWLFKAWRCGSAVSAVVECLSVRLSQAGFVSKRLDESSWYFGTEASLHLFHTVLSGNLDISEIGVLFSGTMSQTPDSKKFATHCQQNSSLSLTVELVDDTYATIDEWWLLATSRSTVSL